MEGGDEDRMIRCIREGYCPNLNNRRECKVVGLNKENRLLGAE